MHKSYVLHAACISKLPASVDLFRYQNFRICILENERIRGVVELSGLDADVEMEDMLEGKGFLIAQKCFILDG